MRVFPHPDQTLLNIDFPIDLTYNQHNWMHAALLASLLEYLFG